MRRQIPGLHLNQQGVENKLDGLFLVRVDRARYRWHPQKPFVEIQFVDSGAETLRNPAPVGAVVLHGKSSLEAQLVSSRFWLRRAAPHG